MLHSMRDEWDVGFAESGQEALTTLEEKGADVIVSDMKMPGMDGAELLDQVMEKYPQVIRIILSGHSDQASIMRSIGPTHQYLIKPCDAETLKTAISRTLGLRRLLADGSLKEIISQIRSLPSLPSLYMEIVKELQSPNSSLKKVGEIISKDMGMTAKVLQLVNSAFFGVPRHISTLGQAVNLLGLDTVKALVLSVQVFSGFKENQLPRALDMDSLWRHSIRVGACAKAVCKKERLEERTVDEAVLAGMLHDVGKLVLAAGVPEQYGKALSLATDKRITHEKAENEVLGTTHAEVGGYLLGLWGLPDPIVEAIAFHHKPGHCVGRTISPLTAVHVGDTVEHSISDSAAGGAAPEVDIAYLAELDAEDRLEEWSEICRSTVRGGGD
jgi:HD-like signal output (HDOD) protein